MFSDIQKHHMINRFVDFNYTIPGQEYLFKLANSLSFNQSGRRITAQQIKTWYNNGLARSYLPW